MIWIGADDVILIHGRIIQTTGGIDGLRDRAGLEAAIAALLQSFGGQDFFPSDIEKLRVSDTVLPRTTLFSTETSVSVQ